MRHLATAFILLSGFASCANAGALVAEKDKGKLIANRIEISIERWDKPRPTRQ